MEHTQYNGIFWTLGTIIFCIAVIVGLLYARRSARKMGVQSHDETVHTASGPVTKAKVSTPTTRGEAPPKQP